MCKQILGACAPANAAVLAWKFCSLTFIKVKNMGNVLEIGEAAPDITVQGYFPVEDKIKEYRLGEDRGKWVVLAFYPGDFTFVCATDVEAFTGIYDEFKKNKAEVYAISTDSIFSHKGWAQASPRVKGSKVPLLEDFLKKVTTEYGFLNRQTGAARRGTVIIDPEGRVQYVVTHHDDLGKDAEAVFNAFMGLKYLYDQPAQKDGHKCAIPANWRVGKEALHIDIEKDIGKL